MDFAMTALASVGVGFLSGLLAFRVKSTWCRRCGEVKRCPACCAWSVRPARRDAGRIF